MTAALTEAIGSIPGISEFPGIDSAWTWSAGPNFRFALTLAGDGEHVYQVNTFKSFDEGLVRELLLFARSRNAVDALGGRHLAVVGDFDAVTTSKFDAIGLASPEVHDYYGGENEWLNERVIAVFPAWVNEFSGWENLNLDQSIFRFGHMLRPTLMDRSDVPLLRMRYNNVETGGGSIGDERGFTTPDVVLRELKELEGGSPESFVEIENFQGAVRMIHWDQEWIISGDGESRIADRDEVLAWATSFLYNGDRRSA